MRLASLVLVAAFTVSGPATGAPCFNIQIEPVDDLTIQQLVQLSSQQPQTNGQHTAIVWRFDTEDRPRRGSMEAVALLVVATGDIGERPVGALVWANSAAELWLENLPRDGFKIVAGRAGENCAPVVFEIHVLKDGTVRANQQVIGKLR